MSSQEAASVGRQMSLAMLHEHVGEEIVSCFHEMYKHAAVSARIRGQGNEMAAFQILLREILDWTRPDREKRCEAVKRRCPAVQQLYEVAVHSSYMMMNTARGCVGEEELQLPLVDDFLYDCFCHAARKVYEVPYLLSDQVPSKEYLENRQRLKKVIHQAIDSTICLQMPLPPAARPSISTISTRLPLTENNLKKHVARSLPLAPLVSERAATIHVEDLDDIFPEDSASNISAKTEAPTPPTKAEAPSPPPPTLAVAAVMETPTPPLAAVKEVTTLAPATTLAAARSALLTAPSTAPSTANKASRHSTGIQSAMF